MANEDKKDFNAMLHDRDVYKRQRMGYEIKVVDLLNMEKSHCYAE